MPFIDDPRQQEIDSCRGASFACCLSTGPLPGSRRWGVPTPRRLCPYPHSFFTVSRSEKTILVPSPVAVGAITKAKRGSNIPV
jgi:hypothetical protein